MQMASPADAAGGEGKETSSVSAESSSNPATLFGHPAPSSATATHASTSLIQMTSPSLVPQKRKLGASKSVPYNRLKTPSRPLANVTSIVATSIPSCARSTSGWVTRNHLSGPQESLRQSLQVLCGRVRWGILRRCQRDTSASRGGSGTVRGNRQACIPRRY
jgi:hypothetical protein